MLQAVVCSRDSGRCSAEHCNHHHCYRFICARQLERSMDWRVFSLL